MQWLTFGAAETAFHRDPSSAGLLPSCSHPNLMRQPSGMWLPFRGSVFVVPPPCPHPYLGRQPTGMWAPVHRSAAFTEKCMGTGWTGEPVLVDQIELACVASTKTATARATATRVALIRERLPAWVTWVAMTTPPSLGGTFARSSWRVLRAHFGTDAETATERLRVGDPSGTAGRVVRPVGQELLPLLVCQAPSGNFAGPRLPVRRIHVPDPSRPRIRHDDDAVAVRRERSGDSLLRARARKGTCYDRPGRDVPEQDVAQCVRANDRAPVGTHVHGERERLQ